MRKMVGAVRLQTRDDIIRALLCRGQEQELLFEYARSVREKVFGSKVEARSVIEYSNICRQACEFCGMSRYSKVKRYRMQSDETFKRVAMLYAKGRRVIKFQTGEFLSEGYLNELLAILRQVKKAYSDLTIMCCFGSLSQQWYKLLKEIGIERYLIKFETSDPKLYTTIKPGDTLEDRMAHIRMLKEMGFLVSSGNIIGLPGQSIESIVDDLLLLKILDIPMVGTTVFIPNDMSSYAHHPAGDINLTLNFMAILRTMCPQALIPTTSSLETLIKEGQYLGLMAGANTVTVHDGTPLDEENKFVIYKKGRIKPKSPMLLDIIKKAGLEPSRTSLIREKPEDSLFYKLINKNIEHNKVAVHTEGRVYSYEDLDDLTSRFCYFMKEKKVKEGDVVLLALPDSIEFVVVSLSCIRMGAVAGIVDPHADKSELKNIITIVSPAWIFTMESTSKKLNNKKVLKIAKDESSEYFLSLLEKQGESRTITAPDKNNPAILLFTSGTTGTPKGVVHTYKDLLVDIFPRTILKMSPNDVAFSYSRIYTSFGLNSSFLFPFHFGASSILVRDIPNPFNLSQVLSQRPTLFFAVPSIYDLLLDYNEFLETVFSNVRIFVVAGDKLYTGTFERWESVYGKRLLEHYGSTEMGGPIISNRPGEEKINSAGRLLDGHELRFDKSGRMFYRGPSLFSKYYDDEELTSKKKRKGWFKSDDVGYMDQDGFIYITGRCNSVFKLNGQWVSSFDVENKLRALPFIKETVLVNHREGLKAFISLDPSSDRQSAKDKIRAYCMEHLKFHEIPKDIIILDKMPKNKSGKINRKHLTEMLS